MAEYHLRLRKHSQLPPLFQQGNTTKPETEEQSKENDNAK